MAYKFYAELSLRGYHASRNITLSLGQKLYCEIEPANEHDVFAVAIRTEEDDTIGHIPQEVSSKVCNFLVDGGEAIAKVIGCRYNSDGAMDLEVPSDVKFCGAYPYLVDLKRRLKLFSNFKKKMSTSQKLNKKLA